MALSYEEKWTELEDRLRSASATLHDLPRTGDILRAAHLDGKEEGARLALSYMDEIDRAKGPSA